jgi:hypothetical protein
VVSAQFVRKLHDTTIEELLGQVLSVRSVPRCSKQEKSKIELVVRESQVSNAVKTKAEEDTELKAVTRRQPVEIQQTEILVRAIVNCRVCELTIALLLLVATICRFQ